jgi:hypothetical protein
MDGYCQALTGQLHAAFTQVEEQCESFAGQPVLITGAGVVSNSAAMIDISYRAGPKWSPPRPRFPPR